MIHVVTPIGSVAISPTPARPASPVSSRTLRGEARALIVQLENTKALQAKQSALIVLQANFLQIRLQQPRAATAQQGHIRHRLEQLSARTAGQGRIRQQKGPMQFRHVSPVRQQTPTHLRGAQL